MNFLRSFPLFFCRQHLRCRIHALLLALLAVVHAGFHEGFAFLALLACGLSALYIRMGSSN